MKYQANYTKLYITLICATRYFLYYYLICRNSEELTTEALSSKIINDSNMSLNFKSSSAKRNDIASSARRQRSKDIVGVSNGVVKSNETDPETTAKTSQEFSVSFIEGIRRKKQQVKDNKVQNPMLLLDELTVDDNIDDASDVYPPKPSEPALNYPAKKYLRLDEISLPTAIELKKLCFGNAKTGFNAEWRRQGFYFSNHPQLRFGLMQEKGGPCGLLTSVQAWILKYLLVDVQQQETGTDFKGWSVCNF